MTNSSLTKSFAIFNARYGYTMQLAVFDAGALDHLDEPSYEPFEEIGVYQNARTLLRIAPISEQNPTQAPAVSKEDLQPQDETGSMLAYQDFLLCSRDRSVHHVQLATVNKLFKIRNASNVFVGTLVYTIVNEPSEPEQTEKENWLGGLIRNLEGSVEAIVVRVSGKRLFAAILSADFEKEWSFEQPPKFTLTEQQKNELSTIKEQAFFRKKDGYFAT